PSSSVVAWCYQNRPRRDAAAIATSHSPAPAAGLIRIVGATPPAARSALPPARVTYPAECSHSGALSSQPFGLWWGAPIPSAAYPRRHRYLRPAETPGLRGATNLPWAVRAPAPPVEGGVRALCSSAPGPLRGVTPQPTLPPRLTGPLYRSGSSPSAPG